MTASPLHANLTTADLIPACLYCPAPATERIVYRDALGLLERALCDHHIDGYLRTVLDLDLIVVGLTDVDEGAVA